MRGRDILGLSLKSIFQTPVRSVLTVLGLSIGIGAIVAITAIGDAGQREVETELGRIGVGRAWVHASVQEGVSLRRQDAGLIERGIEDVLVSASAARTAYATRADETAVVNLTGCDAQMGDIEKVKMQSGRFLLSRDIENTRPVAVIDAAAQASLFGNGNAVGQTIDLSGRRFSVVGVIAPATTERVIATGTGKVYIPITVYETLFGGGVDELVLCVDASRDVGAVAKSAEKILLRRYGEGYEAITLEEEMAAARRILQIFLLVMSCVALICMLVGGIGVMNIMLVCVRERKREIGLMKALGATGWTILMQFLLEAVSYAMLGGMLGMAAGSALIVGASRLIGISIEASLRTLGAAVGFSGTIGLFFGVYPAVRASRMMPVDALRSDQT